MNVISIKEKKKIPNSLNYLYKVKQPSDYISSRTHEKQPILHFVIKAKLSASAPLALTDSYCTRWRPEEEDMSLVRKWHEIKLSDACRLQEPSPGVKKVTSWLMGRFASVHGDIDSLVGFDLFRQLVHSQKNVFIALLEIVSVTKRAVGWLWLNVDLPAAVLWSTAVIHNRLQQRWKVWIKTLCSIALRRKAEWMAWAEEIFHYCWQLCQWDACVSVGVGWGTTEAGHLLQPPVVPKAVHWEEKSLPQWA